MDNRQIWEQGRRQAEEMQQSQRLYALAALVVAAFAACIIAAVLLRLAW